MRTLNRLTNLQTVLGVFLAGVLVYALGAQVDLPGGRLPGWMAGILLCLAGFALGRAFTIAAAERSVTERGAMRRVQSELDALRTEVRRLSNSSRT